MIKYHDNINGVQYGADHILTNNWNPDCDYGNEYVNIHFRIETNGYGYPSFSFTEEDRKSFDENIAKVFTTLGWKCKNGSYNGCCATWINGKSHLYMHPQDFSGEVLKNEVKVIAEALADNKAFRLRWVDLYETVYDITDDEYKEILVGKEEDIKSAVLEMCKTKRTNQYYYMSDVVRNISRMFRVKRIDKTDEENYGGGVIGEYIASVINFLIGTGYLVKIEMDGNILIRTINKTEQKRKKLFVS